MPIIRPYGLLLRLASAVLLALPWGCGSYEATPCPCPTPTASATRQAALEFPDESFFQNPTTTAENEDNGDFDSAQLLPSLVDSPLQVNGAFDTLGDVDVFTLPGLNGGEQLFVLLEAPCLHAKLAAFDQDANLLALRGEYPFSTVDGKIRLSYAARTSASSIYVAVADGFYGAYESCAYNLLMGVRSADAPSPPRPQLVILALAAQNDEDGGTGRATSSGFDAGRIGQSFASASPWIEARMVELVREHFRTLAVEIGTSDDPSVDGSEASIVHFKQRGVSTTGWAEDIDEYNRDPVQNAYIYYDGFRQAEEFEVDPEDLAQALANVVSHEIGHLLGLRHTLDGADLMDVGAPGGSLFTPRSFRKASLDPRVFPIGYQDGLRLLTETVGTSIPIQGD